MKYTALETSNKINVVSGDSIRKTHRTISHTILRQNDHDSYLLHGRHSPFPPPPLLLLLLLLVGRSLVHPFHRPSTFLPFIPRILFYLFFFYKIIRFRSLTMAGTKNEISREIDSTEIIRGG